ncbi:high-affinity nickel-transporter [Enterobacter hormaechei]|nr:high-affinity nickel-transporter [Enterobacter hormaechei]
MSVISSPVSKPRRWLHLWPLALFLLLAVGGALWLWQAWPQVMLKSILWQREVNQQMSGLLKAVAENPPKRAALFWRSALSMACCMPWDRGTAKSLSRPGLPRIHRS